MSLLRNIGVGRTKLIKDWLEKYVNIHGTYELNHDLSIEVYGDVLILGGPSEFPEYIQFHTIHGRFQTFQCGNLRSMRGFPMYVNGNFIADYCTNLESLDGFPKSVGGSIYMNNSMFTAMEIETVCDVKGTVSTDYIV